jgi:hypothetical protein
VYLNGAKIFVHVNLISIRVRPNLRRQSTAHWSGLQRPGRRGRR